MSFEPYQTPQNIVIFGAGIIGLSTAYYLTTLVPLDTTIYVLDPSPELFACASGRAGGFLGSPSWFGPPLKPLAALSKRLHKELSDEYNGSEKWGYCRSIGLSLVEDGQKGRGEDWVMQGGSRSDAVDDDESSSTSRNMGSTTPKWLKKDVGACKIIDDDAAQVYPKLLCEFLLQKCIERGVKIQNPFEPKRMALVPGGLEIETKISFELICCSTVLLSAGPWTAELFSTLFPNSGIEIPITNLPGTSVTLQPTRPNAEEEEEEVCYGVFAVSKTRGFSPEFISRSKGDIYFAGLNAPIQPLPRVATQASPLRANVKKLVDEANDMIDGVGQEGGYSVPPAELCHRPVSGTGYPIMCKVDKAGWEGGNVYIASGHSVWGIALSLGTGKVMAEMMLGKETSADVSGLTLPM